MKGATEKGRKGGCRGRRTREDKYLDPTALAFGVGRNIGHLHTIRS